MNPQTDLFNTTPVQESLFGPGEDRLQAPEVKYVPTPEKARSRLTELLEIAKNARTMPWSARDARMWQTVFPNMANWLPEDEANQFRLEFQQEMQRLNKT